MTSVLDKIRSFHLNTNKRSKALDNLIREHSSQWRQNAHSVTPHTHFHFYNSISIIISILNPLLGSWSLSHESPFSFMPLFYTLCFESFVLSHFSLLLLLFLYPWQGSDYDSFLWSWRSFCTDPFFSSSFSLSLTHLFCHSLTNPSLSPFSFKT